MDLRDHLQSTLGTAYAIERELSGGGMSRVFLAEETALGRKVVVKILPAETAGELSIDRFRREIRLAASLQQANIVPVLSAGEADGVPYYTMPFVTGESLRARLAHGGALPVGECVAILRDVTRALAYAHAEGIVHRDIKPENILLSGGTAVVTDFGIAKALAAAQTRPDATITQLGIALGTPAYIAPEQACADPNIDHRADLYSLGVLAYELATGLPPFTGRTPQQLLAAHIAEPPVNVAERRRDLPRAFATLIMRCLEKDPDHRPQSAREVLEALDTAATPGDEPSALAVPARPSIAVLPFANLSPDAADEYFADGLADEIITDLAPIRSLRVIARASTMRFKGTGNDPLAVARELDVRYVLDGSVRRAGSSLRLTVRLLDAADGSTIWSDKLGGSVEDVFAMQEQVSRTIVQSLRLTLNPHESREIGGRPINDVRAYESYLQARQAMWTFTTPSLDRARQLLLNALEIVGENARLLAALGSVHLLYIETGQVELSGQLDAATECVERLERIEQDSFSLNFLRGSIQWRRGDIRQAITHLERALELAPNSADTVATLWYAYTMCGHDDRARSAANLVVTLDPLTPLFRCLPGACDVNIGRYDAAVAHYRKFAAMDPMNPIAHFFLAWVLGGAGARDEATTIAENVDRHFPATIFGQFARALAFALRHDVPAAKHAITSEMRSSSRQSDMFARIMADLYATIDEPDLAVDALADAVRAGFVHYPYLARHGAYLEPIRQHPRFRALLDVVRGRWERGGASATDA